MRLTFKLPLIALLTTFGGILYFTQSRSIVKIEPTTAVITVNNSSASPNPITFAEPLKQEIPKDSISRPTVLKIGALATSMQHARDLRVLYLNYLQRTNEGGGFYAVHILMRCSAVRQDPVALGVAAESRSQETAKILREERCASFIPSELSSDNIININRDIRAKHDPFMQALRDLNDQSISQENRLSLVAKIISTHDPLLMEQLSGVLFHSASGVVEFNGKTYDNPDSRQIFASAWMAAVCGATSGSCGMQDDFYVIESCSMKNLCANSREDLIANDIKTRLGHDAFRLYSEIYPQMVHSIQNEDVSAFNSEKK